MSAAPDDPLIAAIEQVYRRRYPRFLTLGVAILGDVDWARDAVQEAFLRALRARRDLRRIESLDAWLWRTLVNVCTDERRRPVALPETDETALPEPNGRPADLLEVRAVISLLPERQRLVLFLRHYADLDYESIAQIVGIERGTVAATLHTAHRKVREVLTEVPQ